MINKEFASLLSFIPQNNVNIIQWRTLKKYSRIKE